MNGKLIHKTDIRENSAYIYYGNCKTFTNYQIENVVTKEQFESIKYGVPDIKENEDYIAQIGNIKICYKGIREDTMGQTRQVFEIERKI